MPKSILIDPDEVCARGELEIASIPLNSYESDVDAERERWGDEALRRVFRHMVVIREFETMLNSVKSRGSYGGMAYTHPGPTHLSIGQESATVGQALALGPEDLVFGSHRSHGEILAKCLSAIAQLDERQLVETMERYFGGKALRVVEQGFDGDAAGLAENFVLYGALAEIFGRETGFNRGLGGSMHAFFTPFGSMPNNAIVGASAPIAIGAALFKRVNREPGIAIANIGDSSAGCGPVWEALMLASMDQYKNLWDSDLGGRPPFLLNFFNNFYGMGGQPQGETMGFHVLARLGAGINPENANAERVDGTNPLAVADATSRKKNLLLAGDGPAIFDTVTYRMSGHSATDPATYRTPEEVNLWRERDCLGCYRSYLLEHGLMSESDAQDTTEDVKEKIRRTFEKAIDPSISPYIDPARIGEVMFSNDSAPALRVGTPETSMPKEENPRFRSVAAKSRFGLSPTGDPLPGGEVYTVRDALFEAILHRFYEDPAFIAYGEENRDWGGAFGVYRGLTESLPYHRLFNTPISEAAIIGSAVGYAMCGGRVLVELMYCDFIGRAGDEIFNQLAKWQSMSGGRLRLPVTVRVSVGNRYGAQHSQDWSSMIAHIPGIKVMFPATPYDAKGMMNHALSGTDPVFCFESQQLYDTGELFVREGVPIEYYEVPEGEPVIRREGTDVTVITIGATLYRAMEAARTLEDIHGVSAEVIDLRFVNPLNIAPLVASVEKTGRVVLASDACKRGSFLNDVAANLTRSAFDHLDAPPVIVGAPNWITPPAELGESYFPQAGWIVDAVLEF